MFAPLSRTAPLVILLALGACAGDGGEDSGTSAITAPEVSTAPSQTATSSQDVDAVITEESTGAADITYAFTWVSSAGQSWPQATLPANVTTKGETWTVTALPRSGSGEEGPPGQATVDIVNAVPTVQSAAFDPLAPTPSVDLGCVPVGAEDADGDELFFTYAWDKDGSALSAQTQQTLPGSQVEAGSTYTCHLTVHDDESTGNTVSVTDGANNSPPTASSAVITPANPISTDDLTCTGTGTDPDGDSVSFTYAWTVNGSTVSGVTGGLLDESHFVGGDVVTCAATPSDGSVSGTPATASTNIGNAPPQVSAVLIGPSGAVAADTLTCTPTGSDPDGSGLNWTYAWELGGSVLSETSSFLTPGPHTYGDSLTCTATASDGTESASLTSSTLTIANTPPTVSGVNISPASPTATSSISCGHTATADDDNQGVTVTYAWTVGGSAAGTGSSFTGTVTSGQDLTCTATPNDGVEDGTPVSVTVTIGNDAPPTPTVSITPTDATAETPLTCSASPATDSDGDTITYAYEWFIGTTSLGTGGTLPALNVFRGETVRCEAVGTDGTSSSQPGSATLVISNTPPDVTNVAIDQTTAYEATELSCSGDIGDIDGDNTTAHYRWTVGGTTVLEGDGTSFDNLDGADFNKHNEVVCYITPTDGFDSGAEVGSSTLTILNTPPTAPDSVSFLPGSPTPGNALRCIPSGGVDDDTDSISYEISWLRNGSAFTNTSTVNWPNDTISAGFVGSGDTFQCTAQTWDGEEYGGTVSGTVTVQVVAGCGNGTIDPGEEIDPPSSNPFTTISVDPNTCRWDFTGVRQLYCNGSWTWDATSGCGQGDADMFCKLLTDNPNSTATSWSAITALDLPGFNGNQTQTGTVINVDRNVEIRDGVRYKDESILTDGNHGGGSVIADPVCTNP